MVSEEEGNRGRSKSEENVRSEIACTAGDRGGRHIHIAIFKISTLKMCTT